jgi:hypothetical protein
MGITSESQHREIRNAAVSVVKGITSAVCRAHGTSRAHAVVRLSLRKQYMYRVATAVAAGSGGGALLMELRSTQHTLLQNHAVALSLQQLHSATSVHRSARHFTAPHFDISQQQPHKYPAPKIRTGHVLIAEVLVGALGQRGLCAVHCLAQHVKHL